MTDRLQPPRDCFFSFPKTGIEYSCDRCGKTITSGYFRRVGPVVDHVATKTIPLRRDCRDETDKEQ